MEHGRRILRKRGKSISKMVEEYSNSLPEKDVAEETAINKNKKIIKAAIISPDAE